jgi:hypothetical protein
MLVLGSVEEPKKSPLLHQGGALVKLLTVHPLLPPEFGLNGLLKVFAPPDCPPAGFCLRCR